MIRCMWCGKPLRFNFSGRTGWVHMDTGKTYATYIGLDGKERDDHCALPKAEEN